MSRNIARLAVISASAALGLTLAACGSEQEAAAPSTPTVVSENSSAPVVAGPRPASSAASTTEASETGTRDCGTTAGPDGALHIQITAGSVDCADAQALATKYGPMIATGQIQTVDDWKCGPAQIPGVLAACTRSVDGADQVVSFAP
ncbi:hypothetical protein AAFP30_25080 [Gordonia sp. CPCC 205515]|uniref:hypothetical protein n=1 Tax=Gordonia sp. CPCC 205515 TaxID=3140791 RepID=UPI003AF4025C